MITKIDEINYSGEDADGNVIRIRIWRDDDALNPREDDEIGMMVCFHKRYKLGDNTKYTIDMFDDWDALEEELSDGGKNIVRPLYLYDHGGITISSTPFRCPWDSGQVGFFVLTHNEVDDYFDNDIDAANRFIDAEVDLYDMYLRGDVYGYTVERQLSKCEHCDATSLWEIVDSVGGFYGYDAVIEAVEDLYLTERSVI